ANVTRPEPTRGSVRAAASDQWLELLRDRDRQHAGAVRTTSGAPGSSPAPADMARGPARHYQAGRLAWPVHLPCRPGRQPPGWSPGGAGARKGVRGRPAGPVTLARAIPVYAQVIPEALLASTACRPGEQQPLADVLRRVAGGRSSCRRPFA